ncbi:DNA cytosine methyltransferase [Aminipila luticellarii]|uniref:DNA (cytosine-5-)-methyltransferase n=1 Tax=Aminipila luticellarii TaxID=2507160 RepID=A0A410PTN3_9FIRM|nr:DNA cytosine methyltransferase [Aminipila luticellarii]QAT42295.1 DNA (cytosine-5-)-methyltransferase [Aminipila luticellarii]
MNNLTLGSLFDGSGGFPLGGLISGITPVWASEIEPFPIRVTTKRLPFMKHYGDISQMDGGKIEPVDIITFGSPCTDMSVAGRRAGLEGQQSVLFYQAIRIIKEMRCATNGKYPRYIVWENVPGAFSSNGGEDFKAVLEAVIDVAEPNTQVPMPEKNRWPYADCYMGDGWSVAYRVLDAQFWGVPQRRKRIYLVADFAGGRAFDILFKSEGLSGYSAEGFRSWQRTAGSTADRTGTASLCLNDQGGQRMDVTDDVTATLRAEAHHPPCVLESAGFCTEHSAKSRSIGYKEETSPTLRAGVVPAAVALENHPTDSRVKIAEDGKVQTLTSRMGTGGNNVPLVMKIRSGCEGGGKGPLIQTEKSATLSCNNDQTLFEPKAYGICSKESNAMKSDNPHSGIYEAETSRTLDGNGGNPGCNQGGIAVVESYAIQGSMIGRDDKNGPQGDGINEDVSFTLNTVDRHAVYAMTTGSFTQVAEDKAPTVLARDYKDPTAVCYGIGRDTFNQGKNAKFAPTFEEELQPTLVAKGPGAIQSGYTVRRLTPTECAKLQGFPDWWCDGLGVAEPTMEDIRYWYDVFETHRRIVGSSTKPKSLKQIAKWLRDPHSDAAEYKMWGNGVALPCVVFVLSGIVYCTQSEG